MSIHQGPPAPPSLLGIPMTGVYCIIILHYRIFTLSFIFISHWRSSDTPRTSWVRVRWWSDIRCCFYDMPFDSKVSSEKNWLRSLRSLLLKLEFQCFWRDYLFVNFNLTMQFQHLVKRLNWVMGFAIQIHSARNSLLSKSQKGDVFIPISPADKNHDHCDHPDYFH